MILDNKSLRGFIAGLVFQFVREENTRYFDTSTVLFLGRYGYFAVGKKKTLDFFTTFKYILLMKDLST
jgi:hypothetical protein